MQVSSVIIDGDTWVMYLTAATTYGQLTGAIGRATAPAPGGPWTVDPEPVLEPGARGGWDAGGIGHASVVRTEDGYRMYYSGGVRYPVQMIGMATSPDGITWSKHDDPATTDALFAASDPVLQPQVEDPNVQLTEAGWEMIYRTNAGLGYTTSPDGVSWTRSERDSIVSSNQLSGRPTIFYASFVAGGEQSLVYFEAGNNTTGVYLVVRPR